MTIDEAIEMYKKIASTDNTCPRYCMKPCEECVKECKQILEWLEELKLSRENSNGYNKEDILLNRKAMYNKAIDDFAKRLKTDYVNFSLYDILQNNNIAFENISLKSYQDMIDEIAEQLKY